MWGAVCLLHPIEMHLRTGCLSLTHILPTLTSYPPTTPTPPAGAVLNYRCGPMSAPGPLEAAELVAGAAVRLLHFFDLGGAQRFAKTALHGLTCLLPDYMLLCASATCGRDLPGATREHLALALALAIPVCVVVTKCDAAPAGAAEAVAAEIRWVVS